MKKFKPLWFQLAAFLFCFLVIQGSEKAAGETHEAGVKDEAGNAHTKDSVENPEPHHGVPDKSYWMAPDKEARLANPVNPSLESIARGKEIFVDKCMKCHGPSGRGDGPLSDTLFPRPADLIDYKTRKQPDGALFYKISKGKGAMPAWELLLSGEDRWHLINYIHSLKQKEEKSENTDTAR